ncbi:B12-binding domain-containing protein [Streptomyces sp. NBC_00859]|uniref:cobalamin B12-binding domain-containing protein n=1 Tax=Streptomyces sp. NBC_00859 TaxID=2903682 RepID=UPI00386BA946|nr:cobalamin-dependent protein [Streptomyces sp. NBC_00859]
MTDAVTGITEEVRAAFDHHLTDADDKAAVALTVRLVEDGLSEEEVLLDLVAPAQIAVGSRWAAGEWTVAQEHAATHVSQQVVAAIAAIRPPDGVAPTGDIAVACSDGEWHTLAPRILSEVLRLRGFQVRFLGGHVPPARLISDLHSNGPDVVALSCTLPARLPLADRLFEVCRTAGVPVLAGGPGFGPAGMWARTLGADLYAPDARSAAELLRTGWPPRRTGRPSVDDRSAETYAWLVQQRPALLRGLLEHLPDGLALAADPADPQFDATVEQLGYLTDSLAAGVFVDDPRIFTDCLGFVRGYWSARCSSPDHLDTVVAAYASLLHDSPRTLAHVVAGQEWLAGPPGDGSG